MPGRPGLEFLCITKLVRFGTVRYGININMYRYRGIYCVLDPVFDRGSREVWERMPIGLKRMDNDDRI